MNYAITAENSPSGIIGAIFNRQDFREKMKQLTTNELLEVYNIGLYPFVNRLTEDVSATLQVYEAVYAAHELIRRKGTKEAMQLLRACESI